MDTHTHTEHVDLSSMDTNRTYEQYTRPMCLVQLGHLKVFSVCQTAHSYKAERVMTLRVPVCLLWCFLFALPFN